MDRYNAEENHRHNDLVNRIAGRETRLLNGFYSFAQANDKRMIEIEGNQAALLSRVGNVETRLLEVEKHLNIPPEAA